MERRSKEKGGRVQGPLPYSGGGVCKEKRNPGMSKKAAPLVQSRQAQSYKQG